MADIISTLKGMDDAALAAKLGYSSKLQAFRSDLERADGLSGKAREDVASKIEKAFQPSSYIVEDLGYTIESAERRAKKGSAEGDDMLVACNCVDPPEED